MGLKPQRETFFENRCLQELAVNELLLLYYHCLSGTVLTVRTLTEFRADSGNHFLVF